MTDRFRFAVVGTRFWGEGFHILGLGARDDSQVTALCGRDRVHAQAVADRFSIPRVYTDWREMIAREKLDGIAITTPNHPHHPITPVALDAGLHVISEKPLAMNAAEAREMLERATARQRGAARCAEQFRGRSRRAAGDGRGRAVGGNRTIGKRQKLKRKSKK